METVIQFRLAGPYQRLVHEIISTNGPDFDSVPPGKPLDFFDPGICPQWVDICPVEIIDPFDAVQTSLAGEGELIRPTLAREALDAVISWRDQAALHDTNVCHSTPDMFKLGLQAGFSLNAAVLCINPAQFLHYRHFAVDDALDAIPHGCLNQVDIPHHVGDSLWLHGGGLI